MHSASDRNNHAVAASEHSASESLTVLLDGLDDSVDALEQYSQATRDPRPETGRLGEPIGEGPRWVFFGPKKKHGGAFPCSVVWTPIHPITWVAPFVGHLGVTDSKGRLHDWGGGDIEPCDPQHMMFGPPARYIPIHPTTKPEWDEAIEEADSAYLDKLHCMLLGSDCHSHVADVLDRQRVCGCSCHNKVGLATAVFFTGRYVGVSGFLRTWLGFAICAAIFLYARYVTRYSGGGKG